MIVRTKVLDGFINDIIEHALKNTGDYMVRRLLHFRIIRLSKSLSYVSLYLLLCYWWFHKIVRQHRLKQLCSKNGVGRAQIGQCVSNRAVLSRRSYLHLASTTHNRGFLVEDGNCRRSNSNL